MERWRGGAIKECYDTPDLAFVRIRDDVLKYVPPSLFIRCYDSLINGSACTAPLCSVFLHCSSAAILTIDLGFHDWAHPALHPEMPWEP